MSEDAGIKIKGAAERKASTNEQEATPASVPDQEPKPEPPQAENKAENSDTSAAEDGEVDDRSPRAEETPAAQKQEQQQSGTQQPEYKWCKIFFDAAPGAQNYYFMHFDTRENKYDEPAEPYWIWDALTNNVHSCGLQQPSKTAVASAPGTSSLPRTSEPGPEYQGYNPKIHGSYDPNAPYAKFHEQKNAPEQVDPAYDPAAAAQQAGGDYTVVGAFNRFSGGFQTADKSTERHNDFNKSGRQLNAFFDVDAAANTHGGISLKEERRNQKLSKKEIQEMSKKRREKKEKKRMDFYKS